VSIRLNKRSVIIEDVLKSKLEGGHMPSATELIDLYLDTDTYKRSTSPSGKPTDVMLGNTLKAEEINAMLDEIEIDQMAMRVTLDEAWETLKSTVAIMTRSIPVAQREAGIISAIATRALSLIPEADGVSVGSEALSVSKGIGLGSVSGADMKLSKDIEIDQNAGVLTLSRTSIGSIETTSNMNSWEIDGEYSVKIDKVIGDPSWTLQQDIARTWTVVATTPSAFGRVTLSSSYKLAENSSPMKRIEIDVPDSIETQVDVYLDFDGLGNFEFWERSTGKGKVIVDGPSVIADTIRVELSRFKANDSYFVGAIKQHEYRFMVSEINMVSSAYVSSGDVVTDPIDMSYGQIMSINVDVDATTPATSSIKTFVARNVSGATALEDFMWIPVDDTASLSGLVSSSISSKFLLANDPQKIRTGAGVFSNSIYSIGSVPGSLSRVTEGYGQLECVAATVVANTNGELPALSSVGYDSDPDRKRTIVNASGSMLPEGNYFRLKTCIFSQSQASKSLSLTLGNEVSSKKIYLNGSDITERIEEGQISVPLSPGKNELVIFLSTGETAQTVSFSMASIEGCVTAISRPKIVSETKMNGSDPRVALKDNMVLVNHDPKNMNYLVEYRGSEGLSVDSVRLRIQLNRGMSGETPQVKRAFITAGM
jgi:hypothetical protein